MVPKRPRREDQLVPRLHPTMSMVPHIHGIDLMPTIRGVHEHMSTWMSSLINAQDGCLQAVAQRASMGRTHQEHLAQQVALRSTMPSTSNEVAWLRAQLALRDAQIEQVKAQRDGHFVQEEELLAHMRLLSSEAKDWRSRVVTETEEVLCRESAQMAQNATETQEAMDQWGFSWWSALVSCRVCVCARAFMWFSRARFRRCHWSGQLLRVHHMTYNPRSALYLVPEIVGMSVV